MTTSRSHRPIAVSLYALLTVVPIAAQPIDSSTHLPPAMGGLSVLPIVGTADAGLIRDELERGLPTGQRENGVLWMTGHRVSGCCHLQLGVHRSGAVSLAYSDDALSWSVPLSINNGRVDWAEKLLFVTIRHHEDFGGGFRVSGSTRLTLDSDWSVDATTTLDYSYTERPWMTIHVGPLKTKISMGDPVGKLIDKKIHAVQSAIDSRIETAFGSSTMHAISAVWEHSHQTLQISRQPSVWMQTRPAGVAFRGISAAPDDTFFVVAAIELHLDVFVGDRPPEQPPVPTPESVETYTDPRLEFLVHLPLTEVEAIARTALVGETIDGLPLSQITDVTVNSMPPDRLVVDVSIKLGSINVTASLVGVPRFDTETGEFVIDVDIGGLAGLIPSPLIPGTIRLDVSGAYDRLIDGLREVVADVAIPGLETTAQLDDVSVIRLAVAHHELVAEVQIAGHVGFLIELSRESVGLGVGSVVRAH